MTNAPLFIIPARGGSKGIPNKNIVDLCGRPLIDYTISAALEVATPDRIMLSTDSDEIAKVAERCGLTVAYRRPTELATDTAGSREVLLDAMDWFEHNGETFDSIVLLQPTSPLRNANDIKGSMELYSPDIDMVVSVAEAGANPYYDCFEPDQNGLLHISKGDGLLTRRQDAPKAWQFNGAVYVINPRSLREMPMGKFKKRVPYIMPRERSIDIDTPLDLTIAEAMLRQSQQTIKGNRHDI